MTDRKALEAAVDWVTRRVFLKGESWNMHLTPGDIILAAAVEHLAHLEDDEVEESRCLFLLSPGVQCYNSGKWGGYCKVHALASQVGEAE